MRTNLKTAMIADTLGNGLPNKSVLSSFTGQTPILPNRRGLAADCCCALQLCGMFHNCLTLLRARRCRHYTWDAGIPSFSISPDGRRRCVVIRQIPFSAEEL